MSNLAAKRDYYEVLGVDKSATQDEIKSAYRKKAKECHPDLHPNDKEAEARFKELNEANEVLSDEKKRADYDRFGFNGPNMGGGNPFYGSGGNPFSGMGGFDFSGMGGFDSIFDMFTGGSRRSANGPVKGSDRQYDLQLTFEEAAKGCQKTYQFYREELCDVCSGTGCKPGTSPVTCSMCGGSGQVVQNSILGRIASTCPTCGGSGKVIKDRCTACGGKGRKSVRRETTTTVPAGVDEGQILVNRGKGDAGLRGGENGDLYIRISIKPHKLFRRDGSDLLLDLPISFTQAALGAEIDVPTLDGPIKYRIPEGTQTGTLLRVKGQGIQKMRSTGKGDLIMRVNVEIPKKLTDKQKDILRQFDETVTGKQYENRKGFLDKLKDLFQ